MKNFFYNLCVLITACMFLGACSQSEMAETSGSQNDQVATRAFGDKTPKVVAYVEVNDVNPLNTGSYKLGTSATGAAFFDVVIIFAANVHADANGNPSLHFNDNVTQILNNVNTYIRPLQNMGIKVLLSVLGDHKGIGVANLTTAQAQEYARILTYAVDTYGLDGIDFDDEYAKYGTNGFPNANTTSYSDLVTALRVKLDSKFPAVHKMVTAYDYGYASTLNSTAVSGLDYAWYPYYGSDSYGYTTISGLPNSKWSAQAINLNNSYNLTQLGQIQSRSAQSVTNGMGAILTYDIRMASQVNPLNALKKIAQGAFNSTVTYNGSGYSKNWTPGATYTITSAMLPPGY